VRPDSFLRDGFFSGTGMGKKKLLYLLDNYLGMDKDEVEKIKGVESRAVTIMRLYPKAVVGEKNIYVL